MVNPDRVSSVRSRTADALSAVAFAIAACALVEGLSDRELPLEPSFVALAASLRAFAASAPPLLSAFLSAN